MGEAAGLSRRERQIMDVVYALEQATASDVLRDMPDAPTRAAVRTFLRILEQKGHLRHHKVGREFVYRPTRPRDAAGRSALAGLLRVFYDGSIHDALAAHLSDPATTLAPGEIESLTRLIRDAKNRKDKR